MSRKLFEQLAKEHFILYFNGQLVVTNKFFRTYQTPPLPERDIPAEATPVIIKAEHPRRPEECLPALQAPNLPAVQNMENQEIPILMRFIKECQVPEKITTRTGAYWANRFNAKADKELLKILKTYQYDILVAATKLYYKSGGQPQAISNYILNGVWLGCYTDMLESLKAGTTEKYINTNLKKDEEDGFSRYKR